MKTWSLHNSMWKHCEGRASPALPGGEGEGITKGENSQLVLRKELRTQVERGKWMQVEERYGSQAWRFERGWGNRSPPYPVWGREVGLEEHLRKQRDARQGRQAMGQRQASRAAGGRTCQKH